MPAADVRLQRTVRGVRSTCREGSPGSWEARVGAGLATLEGTLAQLAPGFDLVAETRSFAGCSFSEQLDAASARQAVTQELTTLLPMLRRLPRRVERIASAAENGRLSVHVRLLADERDRRTVTGLPAAHDTGCRSSADTASRSSSRSTRGDPVAMARQGLTQRATSAQIPHPYNLVVAPGHRDRAATQFPERHRVDEVLVGFQRLNQRCARVQVPHPRTVAS